MLGILFLLLIFILLLLGAFFFFTPNNQLPQERNINWEEQQEQKDQAWFTSTRWLTDVEIDWAVNHLEKNDKFKILPAYQFHYVQEANQAEAQAHLAFQELLATINDQSKELIFVPVNQPNFHWSLLVYEVKSKTFYHYDTLQGANNEYIQLLVNQLLVCLLWPWPSNQGYLVNCHDIQIVMIVE